MAETAFAPAGGIAQEALKMLFAMEAGGNGSLFHVAGKFAVDARDSFDAERLDLLDCVYQELRRAPASGNGKPGRDVCRDLLAHLAGGSIPAAGTIQ